MKIFILAAGDTTKWNGEVKQLAMVRGETVLRRIINMVEKYERERREENQKPFSYKYQILTHHKEISSQFTRCVQPADCDKFLATVLSSAHLWEGENEVCFLLGDVIFTQKTFLKVVEPSEKNLQFYGSWEEHFGFRFLSTRFSEVRAACADIIHNMGHHQIGAGWQLYRYLVGIPWDKDWCDRWYRTLILDKTDDIDCPEDYQQKIATGYFDDEEFEYAKDY